MGYNISQIRDQVLIFNDKTSPREAVEAKVVGGTAVTFVHPLTGGIPYVLYAQGTTVYVTLNGTAPVLADGIASASIGIPLAPGVERKFLVDAPAGSSYTLKAIASGSATVVTLYKHAMSASY